MQIKFICLSLSFIATLYLSLGINLDLLYFFVYLVVQLFLNYKFAEARAIFFYWSIFISSVMHGLDEMSKQFN
jgi:hypothetical protein